MTREEACAIVDSWNTSDVGPLQGAIEARRVARTLRQALADAEKRLQYKEGHRALCYYCGEPCNSLAGNPGLWPICLSHADNPGVAQFHHAGCVFARLDERDAAPRRVEALEGHKEPT